MPRRNLVHCLFVIFLLNPWVAEASPASTIGTNLEEFAHSRVWLNAMYYVPHGKSAESLVKNADFFVTGSEGRQNPTAELEATLELFRKDLPAGDTHPQCRFPYRYVLLSQHFSLAKPVSCPSFEAWNKNYKPTQLSLVYASQYISNPSSAFGHAFLLATSATRTKGFQLTYNFSASMPDDISAFSYAWGGIFGWYRGDFSILPYYQRLFQYGNVENRDLWIYPIRLNPSELDFTFRRLWEAVHLAQFTYYFLDENCAGFLLRIFSGVLPELTDYRKPAVYVHPVEVIRILDQAGRLGKAERVPSQLNRLHQSVSRLTPEQHARFSKAISHPERDPKIDNLPFGDALMEFTAYLETEHKGKVPEEYRSLERAVFVERAKLGVRSSPIVDPEDEERAPHLAHDSMAFTFGSSIVRGSLTGDLGYRLAVHSQLDPSPGYLDFSAFEAGNVSAAFNQRTVWLRDFTLVNIENYHPLWEEAPSASWRVRLQLKENLLQDDPQDHHYGEMQFAYGGGIDVGRSLLYAVLVNTDNLGSNLPQRHMEVGPELGIIEGSSKVHAVGYVNSGTSVFFGPAVQFVKAGVSASLFLSPRLTLLQENEFSRLMEGDIQGERSSLGLRWYF